MKRKTAVILSFLLALCLLLSSCAAAGVKPPALIGELEKGAKKKGQALYGLLQNHTVICENGTARYTLVADDTAGADVTAELDALCTAVSKTTGISLPRAEVRPEGANAIFAELVTMPTKVRDYGLNDSLYRIFFSEGNLYIAATNRAMLAEGVRQFTARFVTGEDAAAGDGYLGIPSDTDLFADCGRVFDTDGKPTYTILFPEDASERVKAAAVSLTSAIKDRTGKNVRLKSDFSSGTGTEREIIVGNCNRPGVADAVEKLDRVTYRMEADGKNIYLLGQSDEMVTAAVDAFLATFVTGINAGTGSDFSLPLTFSLEYRLQTVTVAEGGKTDFVLVYAADASEAVKNAAAQFARFFYSFTGATLPICSDFELPNATAHEIRLGNTNRTADEATPGDKEWTILTEEHIRISGGSDRALIVALSQFSSLCAELIYAQNGTEDFVRNAPHLLYLVFGTAYRGTVS